MDDMHLTLCNDALGCYAYTDWLRDQGREQEADYLMEIFLQGESGYSDDYDSRYGYGYGYGYSSDSSNGFNGGYNFSGGFGDGDSYGDGNGSGFGANR